ncbi:winged helix-turn-helix transcriptional regulator [Pseudomonas saudiphocaensis]|uniref:winged helix-turn-helix transcriptional regulator n=1 Tax=Pseudomonas saudiphocaensis TaxID=1499686 RepID=UPI000F78FD7C|nr:helix-turn-helix domain-containing protein [Pseudomonas saudiphocaensis]RRV15029.1 transcriptional regulator [Pseudomonas saudiphocaensis]
MERVSFEDRNCSLARALDVLGDWWNVLIIREALWGTHKFDDFQRYLGMSKGILSKRLKLLQEHGILEKRSQGSSVDYFLTAKGREVQTVIISIMQWGDRWYPQAEGSPVVLVNRQTGVPLAPLGLQDSEGAPLELTDIGLCAGPGANEETRERIRQIQRGQAPS